MKNVRQRIILQDYNVINITKVEVQLLFILSLSTGPPPFVIVVIYCRSSYFRVFQFSRICDLGTREHVSGHDTCLPSQLTRVLAQMLGQNWKYHAIV